MDPDHGNRRTNANLQRCFEVARIPTQMKETDSMNILPALTWKDNWEFTASDWLCRNRAVVQKPAVSFLSTDAPGVLRSSDERFPWYFQITTIDAGPYFVRQWFNGFQISSPSAAAGGSPLHALCLVPEPGVLWGRTTFPGPPVIHSTELPLKDEEWCTACLRGPGMIIALQAVTEDSGVHFCLAVAHNQESAHATLTKYLDLDPWRFIGPELARRVSFWEKGFYSGHQAEVVAQAMEVLLSRIRAPAGKIPSWWLSTPTTSGRGYFAMNDLYAVVPAVGRIDPDVAVGMLKTAVSIQGPQGRIPAAIDRDGEDLFPDQAARPILAAALKALRPYVTPDGNLTEAVLSAAFRHLKWYLHRADPAATGLPQWFDEETSLFPEVFGSGVISPDLPALTLMEIESILSFREHGLPRSVDTGYLEQMRGQISAQMEAKLWQEPRACYESIHPDGTRSDRITLASFLPVVATSLDQRHVSGAAKGLLSEGSPSLLSDRGILLWEKWADDPFDPPVRAMHQILLVNGLMAMGLRQELDLLTRRIWRGLISSVEKNKCLPDNIAEAQPFPESSQEIVNGPCNSNVTAALALSLPPPAWSAGPIKTKGAGLRSPLERRWRIAVFTSAMILVTAVTATSLYFACKPGLTQSSLQAVSGLARKYYDEGRYIDAIKAYNRMASDPRGGPAEVMLGNIYFKLGRYSLAEKHFRRAVKRVPHSPVPLMNLALTLYRMGRTHEALECYDRVIENFSARYPQLCQRARTARSLIGGLASAKKR